MTTDTRSILIEGDGAERLHRRSTRLPERLGQHAQIVLVSLDAATILFVSLVALSSSANPIVASFVTAAIICLVAWQSGCYSRSYAVSPRDEVYYACACVAIAAIPIALILAVVGSVPLSFVAAAIALSALASSVVRVRLHLARRTGPLSATLHSVSPHGWTERENPRYRIAKRIFDLCVAALVLVPVCLIMGIAALAIVADSGYPVLFRQRRIGENGVPFTIYKFRTLEASADSSWVTPADKRITRAGALLRRLSFDELPQILNVLRGEMSIVGPRPEMIEFADTFTQTLQNYAQRHIVTPGITGWAQLYYKRDLSPSDVETVLSYDLFYVEHASVVMDCALVFKTFVELYARRPA